MNWYQLSATQLSDAIAKREGTVVEVVESFIEHIQKKNEEVNAIVIPLFEEARKEARILDDMLIRGKVKGPLHGVPVTVKENLNVKNTPSTWGIEGRNSLVEDDDPSIKRLREAGAIILGKTNAMQLLLGCETLNPVYGRTTNPWDRNRTPGGSSGGEGAAVASLFSPLGIGTDIGGSVRTPAQFCGIHALKPTPGTIPQAPPEGIFHIRKETAEMSSIGPIARSVEDLKLAFQVLAGKTVEEMGLNGLTIGLWETDGILDPSPSISRALHEVSELLIKAGAKVVRYSFPYVKESMQGFYGLMCPDGGEGMKKTIGESKKEFAIENAIRTQSIHPFKRKLMSFFLGKLGQKTVSEIILPFTGKKDEEAFQSLVQKRKDYQKSILLDWKEKGIDLVLCPAFPTPALLHEGSKKFSYEGAYNSLINYLGFCSGAFSYTLVREEEQVEMRNRKDLVHQAAMENERGSAGLPIAVQFVAKPHDESLVLSAMKWLEIQSQDRKDYPPAIISK
ncbi:amidase family protein [Bacillus sp. FJAT-49736]|uniref:amidase n=1 Tax=Bacillus sp. FJAT-49736 TaxID=2833582 RepID=UPI001BC9962D|nr:amidase family protein [Bacillus sp. FJAT-49736]MBS4174686.1 amidase [Bacillus sp. FJAT-49736]